MLIEVTVFYASGYVLLTTVDTESPQSLLAQLEEISPFECWDTFEYLQWRRQGRLDVLIHHSFIYESQVWQAPKETISYQCDYMKRNWTIDLEKSRSDRGTLEICLKPDACRTQTSITGKKAMTCLNAHACLYARNPYITAGQDYLGETSASLNTAGWTKSPHPTMQHSRHNVADYTAVRNASLAQSETFTNFQGLQRNTLDALLRYASRQ